MLKKKLPYLLFVRIIPKNVLLNGTKQELAKKKNILQSNMLRDEQSLSIKAKRVNKMRFVCGCLAQKD